MKAWLINWIISQFNDISLSGEATLTTNPGESVTDDDTGITVTHIPFTVSVKNLSAQ